MKLFKSLILGMACVASLVSCNDYLDINDNPNSATSADAKYYQLLPFAEFYHNHSQYITASNITYYCGQFTTTSEREGGASKWNFGASKRNSHLQQWWFVFCGSNLQLIYDRAMEDEAYHYAGAAKFLRAAGFMTMTDVFGEIPYTEAFGESVAPKYDTGKTIFMGCLEDLDEAIELFSKEQPVSAQPLSTGDSWNNGDINKWIKMCYLFKARWLNHLSKKAAGSYKEGKYDETEILNCLAKAQQSNADNTLVRHTDTNGPTTDEAGWDETVDYSPLFSCVGMNNNRYYVTKYFYDNLTNFSGNGIEDPRADKLIPWARSKKSATSPANVKWTADEKWRRSAPIDMSTNILKNGAPYANSFTSAATTAKGQTLTPNSWYCNTDDKERWGDTIYVQGRCGSTGYNGFKDLLYRVSPGVDESALGGHWHGRPDAPSFMAAYHEACFIKAEVLMRKGDKSGAYAAYREGVKANIELLNDQCKTWVATHPSLESCPSFTPATAEEINSYLDNALGSSSDITMGKIMTQKQIAMVWTIEQWLDMRRHDYDKNIFLGWDKPFDYYNTADYLTYMPLNKLPRRWPQASYETNYNSASLEAIGAEVPGASDLPLGEGEGGAWYNSNEICTLPVWWDSDQE